MKNVAKSSAVRVDEGEGGGGQRREENVLKSMRELGLSLERCLQRTSDRQGAEGVVWTGLEDKGQTVSKQDVRVEQKVSVALLASRDDNCLGEEAKMKP